ncbi:MAG: phosphate ABC transporter substrate-binding protein PstS [Acidobacteria bacterium]|nr:phosphate ABC transporter substrate-binding protein PstS [Acidobacteriota bacterium]
MKLALKIAIIAIALGLTSAAWSQSSGRVLLNGAGATFPYPMYSKWFDEYHKLHPNIQINYQSIGSGGGIRQITERTVDFGATDGPMTDEQIKEFKNKWGGVSVLHFPTVLGAVVPTYNIPGVTQELKFTLEALAGIYLGKITKWNDPEIAKANPGVKLSAAGIVVVRRADGSGTTYVWVDYLSKVSAEWKNKVGVGTSVNWPVGLGGKGNEGVSGLVKQTPNSIGYVELIYAVQNKLPYGSVRNSSGNFVKANLESVTAAAAAFADKMPEDFRLSITNPPGKDAYPVSSFTWLLVPAKIDNPQKKKIMTDFLRWMLTDGQKLTATLTYAPLPQAVVAKETKAISLIQ